MEQKKKAKNKDKALWLQQSHIHYLLGTQLDAAYYSL